MIATLLVVSLLAQPPAPPIECEALAARLMPEAPAVARALTASLCAHLVADGSITSAAVADMKDVGALVAAATAGGRRDLLDAGADWFERAEAAARAPVTDRWIAKVTAHYVVLARPDTAAARDLAMVAEELEATRDGLARAFELSERLVVRDRRVRAAVPDGVDVEVEGRIPVFLHPNRASAGQRVGRHSYGSAALGASLGDSGRVALAPAINVVYVDALSIAVAQHEVAHLAAMMSAFDISVLDGPIGNQEALKRAFFAGYRKLPAFVTEGLADYGLYYEGFYTRWAVFGPVRALAAAEISRLPPLAELLRSDLAFHGRRHKAFSLASATWLQFLRERHGAAKVRDWLLAGADMRTFRETIGVDLAASEREWIAWLKAP